VGRDGSSCWVGLAVGWLATWLPPSVPFAARSLVRSSRRARPGPLSFCVVSPLAARAVGSVWICRSSEPTPSWLAESAAPALHTPQSRTSSSTTLMACVQLRRRRCLRVMRYIQFQHKSPCKAEERIVALCAHYLCCVSLERADDVNQNSKDRHR
jgi:hypothetical protein